MFAYLHNKMRWHSMQQDHFLLVDGVAPPVVTRDWCLSLLDLACIDDTNSMSNETAGLIFQVLGKKVGTIF